MNEVIRCMYERKSVRNYKDRAVPEELIDELLKVAIQAPSGLNEQPWGFVIVKDKALIREISDYCKKMIGFVLPLMRLFKPKKLDVINRFSAKVKNKELNLFYNAPVLICVCARKDAFTKALDASAAVENMLLAAHSLGLGGCWIGLGKPIASNKKWRSRLGIPDNFTLEDIIVIGYPDDASEKKVRQKPLVLNKIG